MREGLTEIAFILDRSGSMQDIINDTIGGLMAFIKEQKEVPGEANIDLVFFDDKYDIIYEQKPLNEADEEEIRKQYTPRGWTALYDAIGVTVKGLSVRYKNMREDEMPEKTLVVIVTDGEENHSKEYNSQNIQDLIKEKRELGWEFIFLVADEKEFRKETWSTMDQSNLAFFDASSPNDNSRVYGFASKSATMYRSATPTKKDNNKVD